MGNLDKTSTSDNVCKNFTTPEQIKNCGEALRKARAMTICEELNDMLNNGDVNIINFISDRKNLPYISDEQYRDYLSAYSLGQISPNQIILELIEIYKKISEIPVMIDKPYEIPVMIDKPYEIPVMIDKPYEIPVMIDKPYEIPVMIDKPYEIPVMIDKPID